jgi:uncharacterized membrane protein YoaK (UPF0700 family)
MKLHLYETRVQWATAVFLALIAGYLDGYGLLFLKTYVSFMSGNTTFAGLKSGQGNFEAALPSAIAIVFFVTGSFLGNLSTQSKLRYSHRLIFGVTAGLLATVAGLEWHGYGSRNIPSEIAMLSLAMGMMNPALSKVGAESVSLTFVTGTLSRVGGHLAAAAGGNLCRTDKARGIPILPALELTQAYGQGFWSAQGCPEWRLHISEYWPCCLRLSS